MGKTEKKRESWQERRKRIKHKCAVPFIFVEWTCEQTSYFLGRWAFLEILEYAGRLAILVAVISYFMGAEERQRQAQDQQKAKHYQAWQVINAARGQQSSGGRRDALQDLSKDSVSLAGVDISKARLPKLNLENADLAYANLAGVNLFEANLTGADLEFANLTGANLQGANLSEAEFMIANLSEATLSEGDLTGASLTSADLTGARLSGANLTGAELWGANLANVVGWESIRSIEHANIYGVRNAPLGFTEWATEGGAVNILDDEEWEKMIRGKKKQKAGNSTRDQKKAG